MGFAECLLCILTLRFLDLGFLSMFWAMFHTPHALTEMIQHSISRNCTYMEETIALLRYQLSHCLHH